MCINNLEHIPVLLSLWKRSLGGKNQNWEAKANREINCMF